MCMDMCIQNNIIAKCITEGSEWGIYCRYVHMCIRMCRSCLGMSQFEVTLRMSICAHAQELGHHWYVYYTTSGHFLVMEYNNTHAYSLFTGNKSYYPKSIILVVVYPKFSEPYLRVKSSQHNRVPNEGKCLPYVLLTTTSTQWWNILEFAGQV